MYKSYRKPVNNKIIFIERQYKSPRTQIIQNRHFLAIQRLIRVFFPKQY